MIKKVLASDYAKLDSNVYTGGGTDDTAALQSLLDKAKEWGGIHLVMDGAALVTGLKLHSNTTIECLSKSCGFYLADDSNDSIVSNRDVSFQEIKTSNITLLGGTYNHNCLHQEHDVECTNPNLAINAFGSTRHWMIAVEFYGIEYLNVKDVTIRDQRTFAFTIGNFRHVNIENTYIELENEILFGNQDGFHFWGPGQFLTMRNVGGKTQDDFMNIGPDERDGVSGITDVLIDGVMLDGAWQGIRLLSRGDGILDRVTIRNVVGTYRSFGFYINPWFVSDKMGNFGNIVFENINLKALDHAYASTEYTPDPFLFSIGGDVQSLTLKNIQWNQPSDNRRIFQIGFPYPLIDTPLERLPRIRSLLVDGLQVTDDKEYGNDECVYMLLQGIIDKLTLRNADITCPKNAANDLILRTRPNTQIGRIVLDSLYAENMNTLMDLNEGAVDKLVINNLVTQNVQNVMVGKPQTVIGEGTKI